MTKVKCFGNWQGEDDSPCRFRDKNDYCTKEEITLRDGDEGYAMFEVCCESCEAHLNIKCPQCDTWTHPFRLRCQRCGFVRGSKESANK